MPPAGTARRADAVYDELLAHLETKLDQLAEDRPDPGRTATFRRLNRTEYRNAIRDLLALEIDVTELLPRDDAAFGFDNVNAGGRSPTLMERYLTAAQKTSRLAVGSRTPGAGSRVVVLPADRTQEDHVDGLPFGTRGGTAVPRGGRRSTSPMASRRERTAPSRRVQAPNLSPPPRRSVRRWFVS